MLISLIKTELPNLEVPFYNICLILLTPLLVEQEIFFFNHQIKFYKDLHTKNIKFTLNPHN